MQDIESALQLADEIGVAAAARRTGVPAGTLYARRSRSGQAGPPSGVAVGDWVERKQKGAEEAWEAAQRLLSQVNDLTAAGKTADAQRAALGFAILVDKSHVLESAAQQAEDRKMRLVQRDAETLVAVLRTFLSALDLPVGGSTRKLITDLLRQAVRGADAIAASPSLSQPAREELRARLRSEIRAELEAGRAERGLPAPPEEKRVVESPPESAEECAEEVVEAEIVEDEPPLDAAEISRKVAERIGARQSDGLGFGVGRHDPAGSTFSINEPADSTVRYGPQRWA